MIPDFLIRILNENADKYVIDRHRQKAKVCIIVNISGLV